MSPQHPSELPREKKGLGMHEIKPLKPDGAVRKLHGGPPGKRGEPVATFPKCGTQLCPPMPGSGQAKVRTCPSSQLDSRDHQQELRAQSQYHTIN